MRSFKFVICRRTTHVERAMHCPTVILKRSRVDEEGRDEIYSVIARKLGMLHELRLPSSAAELFLRVSVSSEAFNLIQDLFSFCRR